MVSFELMQDFSIHDFQVLGDSSIGISFMHNIQSGCNVELGKIHKRTLSFANEVDKLRFYHVRRHNSLLADQQQAKIGIVLGQGW